MATVGPAFPRGICSSKGASSFEKKPSSPDGPSMRSCRRRASYSASEESRHRDVTQFLPETNRITAHTDTSHHESGEPPRCPKE